MYIYVQRTLIVAIKKKKKRKETGEKIGDTK